METNDLNVQPVPQPSPGHTIDLSDEALYYLDKSGQWANFLGIVGFIFCGFIILIAIMAGSIFSMISQFSSSPIPAGMGGVLSFMYAVFGVMYFFPSLYLYQFGNRIRNGVGFRSVEQVTMALSRLKSLFKFMGITTIVVISVYILIIIVAIIGGIGAASMMHH